MPDTRPTLTADDKPGMPPPGSRAAIDAGCLCPVMDNGHGRGYMGGVKDPETGETIYVYRLDCPVHKQPEPRTP